VGKTRTIGFRCIVINPFPICWSIAFAIANATPFATVIITPAVFIFRLTITEFGFIVTANIGFPNNGVIIILAHSLATIPTDAVVFINIFAVCIIFVICIIFAICILFTICIIFVICIIFTPLRFITSMIIF
jgi:hypothetical protein